MSNPNILPSDRVRLAGVIDPDAYAVGTVTSGWVSMADYQNIMAVVFAGDLGTAATLDAKIEQASDSAGTGAKDITGKAIMQLTKAGTDDNKQAVINVHHSDLDVDNSFTHVRLSMTVGTAASDAGGVIFGFDARYEPEADAASVDEIVS
ncbi:MAG: hypothetical protein ACE5EM_11640 [Sphingomonadales bacterium]